MTCYQIWARLSHISSQGNLLEPVVRLTLQHVLEVSKSTMLAVVKTIIAEEGDL
jgi:hypothetical protein